MVENLSKSLHHFKRPEVTKPFLIIIFLSIIQQFSGMSVLRAYVVKIFAKVFETSVEDVYEGNGAIKRVSLQTCFHTIWQKNAKV